MLKKIARRLSVGRASWDPVAYWRTRAQDPATVSVMWSNVAYNALVDRDEWAVIERELPAHGTSVLDLGCGTGRMSERLAARFETYTGVDLDTMVAEAERRNPSLVGRYVATTVQDYEYPEGAFDFVLALGVLATACTREQLPDVARRIARSVRSGGRLLLIEPFHIHPLLTRGCKSTSRDVASVFEGYGMHLERLDGMLFPPTRFALGEKVFARLPRLTERAYELGERVVRLDPTRLSDYGIIVLGKR